MARLRPGFVMVGLVVAMSMPALAETQLEVDGGVQLGSRDFDGAFVDSSRIVGNVRGLSATALPMAFVAGEVWLSDSLGVYSHFSRTLGATAQSLDEELGMSLSDARVDAKWRRVSRRFTTVASVGAGRTEVGFEPSSIEFFLPTDLPEIDYRYLRAGLSGRYDRGFASFFGGIGAMAGRDHGVVSNYLGDNIAGMDFEVGASAQLAANLDLRLMLNLREISHVEEDLARDRFYSARLTLAYTR